MQANVALVEAEPGEHSVKSESWIGISGFFEIIGAFNVTRHCRTNGGSDLREIALEDTESRLGATF